MNKNIDLTKILKNAPKGLVLYSTLHGEVELVRVDNGGGYPIATHKGGFIQSFRKDGRYYNYEDGECVLFPSKGQRDWNKFTAPWDKEEKFDPKTLQPFDKVLVRDGQGAEWRCNTFSHINYNDIYFRYTTTSARYKYCIPYNEDTKHLIGTKEEAPKYYRYWED